MLDLFGWKVECTVPDYQQCIICVAPHTSNWDFVLGEFAWWSLGRRAGFLIKDSWFFFPMKYLFKALGGIPVSRKGSTSLTQSLVKKFNDAKLSGQRMVIAITPEGTRSKVSEWHTGFLRIVNETKIPLVLGAIDAEHKLIHLQETYVPTGDIEADMRAIKNYYKPFTGLKAGKFSAE